jgi:hypothetical protein
MSYIKNTDLVKYAQSKLEVPTIYILGGIGRALNEDMIQRSISRGVTHTIANQNRIRQGIGRYAFDCNAIFKCALWEKSPGVINYNVPTGSDLGVRSLHKFATEKGLMATMPDIPGLMVFTQDLTHVGMYVGKKDGVNQYIEATPRWNAWGVTTSADRNHPQGHNRTWHSWGKYHLAEYVEEKKEEPVKPAPTPTPAPAPSTKLRVGDTVQWSGRLHKTSFGKYPSSTSYSLRTGRISIIADAPFGIHIGSIGWISPSQVKTTTQPAPAPVVTINRGDTVRVTGTRWATGQLIPSWVKTKRYRVIEVDRARERVLLEGVHSWAHIKDVVKV